VLQEFEVFRHISKKELIFQRIISSVSSRKLLNEKQFILIFSTLSISIRGLSYAISTFRSLLFLIDINRHGYIRGKKEKKLFLSYGNILYKNKLDFILRFFLCCLYDYVQIEFRYYDYVLNPNTAK
jgi:hypothetical protein